MSITEKKFLKLPVLAAIVALIGLLDSAYLTFSHYTAKPVPCSIVEGCELVLTSPYATLSGILTVMFGMEPGTVPAIPLALFGALAYLSALVLALLSVRGNRLMWKLFSAQAIFMALFSVWLIYLQAVVIGAFCQFCLLSAGTSFTLFIIALISFFRRPKFV